MYWFCHQWVMTMNLSTLEDTYKDFYVPAFKVSVSGRDIVRELFLTVTSAEVDLQERAAGRFTFTVANAFDWEARDFVAKQEESNIDLLELFAFGSEVEVFFGYSDTLRSLLSGIVTEIGTSFSEGGIPELTVSGYDDLYPLTTGKNTRHWEQVRDSDAVAELVASTGLRTSIKPTHPTKERIDQSQEPDFAFLVKLAERNGATFYVRGGEFYFGPRNNDKREAFALPWGKGLLSFSPEANLARQVQAVEVHGRSVESGEAIVGRASSGRQAAQDPGSESGSDTVARALNNQPTMRVRAAVHTQAEADARAQAILEEREQEFVTGSGESIGLPDIVPDINIALKGIGRTFSKTYYVDSAKHKVDGSGYRTSFSVKETSI